jgi:hypothetical protein
LNASGPPMREGGTYRPKAANLRPKLSITENVATFANLATFEDGQHTLKKINKYGRWPKKP